MVVQSVVMLKRGKETNGFSLERWWGKEFSVHMWPGRLDDCL
jgi:hypothetical protein